MGLDVMGSDRKLKIGQVVKMSGPRGLSMDGTVPAVVLREATFEDWKNSEPKPNMVRSEEEYRKGIFYWVSVD